MTYGPVSYAPGDWLLETITDEGEVTEEIKILAFSHPELRCSFA